ncbi:type III secretion system inner membrane ring lipoprotein SctJ [Paracoccus onubensis]|uniref:Lipoprotein n=1 Tax=Paracoccus onubensis TaxID=1675788 RepID=A0A418T8N4_9RHOB|nr:type III secretion inner membrane ring lipoprotein SctJ [Paracoccus onubensis]RJE89486.1 EscJ/YscJ/HrcJ family type III secretion inner membrane ring protein [Paracoccus onubensis]
MIAGSKTVIRILAVAAILALAACQEDLYTNLDEPEANSMIATLERNNIPASRMLQDDGRMTVRVDKARFSQAVDVLAQAGLPRQKFASMGDVFQQDGLVASPTQERARMLFALSEELSHTVTEIDGVQVARVHIVLPDNDPLRRNAQPSSASVFIRHDSEMDVQALIPQIKTLVANSISGLTYDKVSVVPSVATSEISSAQAPEMKSLLGIWVLPGSYARLVVLLSALSAVALGTGTALAWFLWHRRSRPQAYLLEPSE